MTKRITRLTDAQKAAIPAHVAKWIEIGQRTGEADWATFEDAARRCYQYTGLPWHGRVVRVANPLVLSLAAPIAAHLLQVHHDAVRDAVGGAVRGAVRGAVDDAVGGAVLRWYYYRLGGQWWINWQAWTSYFRDVCDLELSGDLWDRDRAYADMQSSAGWSWPHRSFTMVCNRPSELHLEQVAPTGWGSHRLHNETGPAVRWPDGWALHFWHGTRVPADLVEGDGWAPDRIMRERNTEVRRCAIEKRGWDRFVTDANLKQVGKTVPDPGNPGGDLALYDVPAAIYDAPVRVLICRNGTCERDGQYRRFGLTCPASISDPVAAAAWTYGLGPREYTGAERRT